MSVGYTDFRLSGGNRADQKRPALCAPPHRLPRETNVLSRRTGSTSQIGPAKIVRSVRTLERRALGSLSVTMSDESVGREEETNDIGTVRKRRPRLLVSRMFLPAFRFALVLDAARVARRSHNDTRRYRHKQRRHESLSSRYLTRMDLLPGRLYACDAGSQGEDVRY